jgi:hypothetical protein
MVRSIPVSAWVSSQFRKFRNRSDTLLGRTIVLEAKARAAAAVRLTNKFLRLCSPAFAGATLIGIFGLPNGWTVFIQQVNFYLRKIKARE